MKKESEEYEKLLVEDNGSKEREIKELRGNLEISKQQLAATKKEAEEGKKQFERLKVG